MILEDGLILKARISWQAVLECHDLTLSFCFPSSNSGTRIKDKRVHLWYHFASHVQILKDKKGPPLVPNGLWYRDSQSPLDQWNANLTAKIKSRLRKNLKVRYIILPVKGLFGTLLVENSFKRKNVLLEGLAMEDCKRGKKGKFLDPSTLLAFKKERFIFNLKNKIRENY